MDGKGGTGLLLIVSQWIIPENSRRLAQASLSRRKKDQQLQDMVDLKRKYAKKKSSFSLFARIRILCNGM